MFTRWWASMQHVCWECVEARGQLLLLFLGSQLPCFYWDRVCHWFGADQAGLVDWPRSPRIPQHPSPQHWNYKPTSCLPFLKSTGSRKWTPALTLIKQFSCLVFPVLSLIFDICCKLYNSLWASALTTFQPCISLPVFSNYPVLRDIPPWNGILMPDNVNHQRRQKCLLHRDSALDGKSWAWEPGHFEFELLCWLDMWPWAKHKCCLSLAFLFPTGARGQEQAGWRGTELRSEIQRLPQNINHWTK